MPHVHRFYHPATPPIPGEVELSQEESHHAMRVLRARAGDPVELFNGRGHGWRGVIAGLSKREVRVTVADERFVPRANPPITLAQAWLHRDKLLDELVRQATVIGVDELLFFRADHSEKQPRISDKWERLAIEACKQCGRLWLPGFGIADSLEQVLATGEDAQFVIARMDGPHKTFAGLSGDRPIIYIVGPEGDFSEKETAAAQSAHALPISLGEYTLRAETAAITGLTILQYHLGRLGSPA